MPTMTHRFGDEQSCVQVTGGVDTHADTHTAAALDQTGGLLGHRQFPATPAGYTALLAWLRSFGLLVAVGIEGSGAYGAGLTAFLQARVAPAGVGPAGIGPAGVGPAGVGPAGVGPAEGVELVEVDRPDRRTRRARGKSDPVDAEAAARAVQARRATGVPKTRGGRVDALCALRVARRSAVTARAQALTQMKTLIVTADEPLRTRLRALSSRELITHCASRRPDRSAADQPATATVLALRALARRHQHLTTEIDELATLIAPLVAAINPALLALPGVGPDVAGALLTAAGDNPHRLHSEAAFAMLCGVAPLPASSGKTMRHRLNRGGNRQANAALYRITLCRLQYDPRTRGYAQRRTSQGMSKPEIIRCLKRYIAREIYTALLNPHHPPSAA